MFTSDARENEKQQSCHCNSSMEVFLFYFFNCETTRNRLAYSVVICSLTSCGSIFLLQQLLPSKAFERYDTVVTSVKAFAKSVYFTTEFSLFSSASIFYRSDHATETDIIFPPVSYVALVGEDCLIP